MGNKWSAGFLPECSAASNKYFVARIHTGDHISSHESSNWLSCRNFIRDGFLSMRFNELKHDSDLPPVHSSEYEGLNRDISLNGWVERKYSEHGIVRGMILPVKHIYVELTYDRPSTERRINVKSSGLAIDFNDDMLIDVINDLLALINVNLTSTLDHNIVYAVTDQTISILKEKFMISTIQGDPRFYLDIKLVLCT